MGRKKRTDAAAGGESSQSQEASGGRGGQRPPAAGGGAYQGGGGGRGWASQPQQGGRGGGGYGASGRGGPQRGGMSPQQYGAPQQYQGSRGYQPRGPAPSQQQSGVVYESGGRRHGSGPSPGGPSRPPVPDLPQATQAPYQAGLTPQPMPPKASSSSRPPEQSHSEVTMQVEQLSLQPEGAPAPAIQPVPPSSKSMRFPLRPGKGSTGIRCIVKANHFFAELPDKDLHQYDVSIIPEVTSRAVNRNVMEKLVKLYRESHLGQRLPAYDGRKSLYTAGPLPFVSKEFKITLIDEEDGSGAPRFLFGFLLLSSVTFILYFFLYLC